MAINPEISLQNKPDYTIQTKSGKSFIVDYEFAEEVNKYHWYFHHGYVYSKYKAVNKRQTIALHQFVYFLKHRMVIDGSDGLQLDHINRNRADNRLDNLRPVTRTQQNDNRKLQRSNLSGFQGVSLEQKRNRYRADFYFQNKRRNLGYFQYLEEAALSYLKAFVESRGFIPPAYTFDKLAQLRRFDSGRYKEICELTKCFKYV